MLFPGAVGAAGETLGVGRPVAHANYIRRPIGGGSVARCPDCDLIFGILRRTLHIADANEGAETRDLSLNPHRLPTAHSRTHRGPPRLANVADLEPGNARWLGTAAARIATFALIPPSLRDGGQI